MTRACLRWAVLIATLGCALLLAANTQAQICTDYYRFGPIYSNVGPFVDGCMEDHGAEQTTYVETVAANDCQENFDLSGRSVVAIIEDLDDDADQANETTVADDTQVAADTPEASTECPHYSYWEDYYGYDHANDDCPCYEEPADDLASQDSAVVVEQDVVEQDVVDQDVVDFTDQYDLNHSYADYIEPQDSASPHQDEPAAELVEAETTGDIWDEAQLDYDSDCNSLHNHPCDPENNTHPEEDASELVGDEVGDADSFHQYEQPYDAYDYDESYEDCYEDYYEDACHHGYESDAMVDGTPQTEVPVPCYDYEMYHALQDQQENSQQVAQDVTESDSYDAYDYDYDYDDDYDDYDYDRSCYDSCEEELAADTASVVNTAEEAGAEEVAQENVESDGDATYDYDYDYYRGCYDRCEEELAADEASEVTAAEELADVAAQADADESYSYDMYDEEYDYYRGCYDNYDEPAVDESSDVVVAEEAADQDAAADVEESNSYDPYDDGYGYDYGYDDGYDYDAYDGCYDETPLDESPVDESPVDESSDVVVAEEAADQEAAGDVEESNSYDSYDDGYDYDYDAYDDGDDYDYGYNAYDGCYDETPLDESPVDESSDVVVAEEAADQDAAADVEESNSYDSYDDGYDYDYDAYDDGDDYGYDYDAYDGCYDETPLDESPLDESPVEESSEIVVAEEAADQEAAGDVEESDSYDPYDDGYDYDYGYDAYDGCYDETPLDESPVDESSDVVVAEEVVSEEVAQDVETTDAYDAYDYDAYDYEAYDYEAYDYEAYEYGDQSESGTQEAGAIDESEQSAADESGVEYDMYEYDYYRPYDASPAGEAADEQPMVESDEAYEYDSYEVYDYDNEPLQDDAEVTSEVDEPAATEESSSQMDEQYYGRYPYGYGYGYGYDQEYADEYHSNSTVEVDAQSDCQTAAQLEFDFERTATLGRQLVDSVRNASVVQSLQTQLDGLQQKLMHTVASLDLAQLRNVVNHSVKALIESQDSDLGLSDGNVFLFEIDVEDAADVVSPISLDETPWMIEDQIVGQTSVDHNDTADVEPASDPLSVVPPAARLMVSDWAGRALAKAKTTWDTLSPELERIAVETLAKASVVESATTQR